MTTARHTVTNFYRIRGTDPQNPSQERTLRKDHINLSRDKMHDLTVEDFPELPDGVYVLQVLNFDGTWEDIKILWIGKRASFIDRLNAACIDCNAELPWGCDDLDSCVDCQPATIMETPPAEKPSWWYRILCFFGS